MNCISLLFLLNFKYQLCKIERMMEYLEEEIKALETLIFTRIK